MKFEFKKTFQNADPFIYETPYGLYYIGYGICRPCDAEEKEIHKNFVVEFSNVQRLQYLTKTNTKKLVELFEKILQKPKCIDSSETRKAKKELAESLTDDEIQRILLQRDSILKIYNYEKGRFN